MQDFKNLKVWTKAHQLTLAVYRQTRTFPADEKYELTSQFRRATVSIAANIAEGSSRESQADFRRFLEIALGSLSETQYYLILSRDLDYLKLVDHEHLDRLMTEIRKMLAAFIIRLRPPARLARNKPSGSSENC